MPLTLSLRISQKHRRNGIIPPSAENPS
jgi:hypothetical protein